VTNQHNPRHASPRLLNDEAASDYLALPRAAMKRLTQGRIIIDGKVRWDRLALDVWLDGFAGLTAPAVASSNQNDAEAALERFITN
jgi:hypothetical protein